jgi:hypothetical protein
MSILRGEMLLMSLTLGNIEGTDSSIKVKVKFLGVSGLAVG